MYFKIIMNINNNIVIPLYFRMNFTIKIKSRIRKKDLLMKWWIMLTKRVFLGWRKITITTSSEVSLLTWTPMSTMLCFFCFETCFLWQIKSYILSSSSLSFLIHVFPIILEKLVALANDLRFRARIILICVTFFCILI